MKKLKDTKVGRIYNVSSDFVSYSYRVPKTVIRKATSSYQNTLNNLYNGMRTLVNNSEKPLRRIFLECGNDSHVIHITNSGHIKFFSHPDTMKEVIFYTIKYPSLDAKAIEGIPTCILLKRILRERLYTSSNENEYGSSTDTFGIIAEKLRYSNNKVYDVLKAIQQIFKSKKALKVHSSYNGMSELEEFKVKRIRELANYTINNSNCRTPKDTYAEVSYDTTDVNIPTSAFYTEKITTRRARRGYNKQIQEKEYNLKFTVGPKWYGKHWKKGLALVDEYVVTNIIKPLDKGAYLCDVIKPNRGFSISVKKAVVFPVTVEYNENHEPKLTGGHVKLLSDGINDNSEISVRRPNQERVINPSTNPVVTDLNMEKKENGEA